MPSGAAQGTVPGGARMESCAGPAACLHARQRWEAGPPGGEASLLEGKLRQECKTGRDKAVRKCYRKVPKHG